MRQHASLSYPSELPLLVDLGVLLLVSLLFLIRPQWVERCAAKITSVFDSSASGGVTGLRKSNLSGLGLWFVAACALHLTTLLALGVPIAWVSDEQAYLLASETHAGGKLTNPAPVISPELDRHIEQDHILSTPTRQSKYPPGQALVLALGQSFGSPALSLTLLAGLLATTTHWCLSGMLAPPMASLGALTMVLWVGIGSYWNQSYWGGSLAAIGGGLVLGACARMSVSRAPNQEANLSRALSKGWGAHGIVLGLGLVILGISRPYEGLIFALPLTLGVAYGLRPAASRDPLATTRLRLVRGLLIATIVSFVGLASIAAYNRAVTGDPWLLPHVSYTTTGPLQEQHFHWTVNEGLEWIATVPQLFFDRLAESIWFLIGLPLALALFLGWLLPRYRTFRTTHSERSTTSPVRQIPGSLWVATIGVLVAQSLTVPFFPHYTAPATIGLVALALAGLQQLDGVRFLGRSWQAPLLVALVLGAGVGAVVRLPAHRPDPTSDAQTRLNILQQLEQSGGRHLVLVDRAGQNNGSWVHNSHEPLQQTVLWARALSAPSDQRLVDALGRTSWRLTFEQNSTQLRPFKP